MNTVVKQKTNKFHPHHYEVGDIVLLQTGQYASIEDLSKCDESIMVKTFFEGASLSMHQSPYRVVYSQQIQEKLDVRSIHAKNLMNQSTAVINYFTDQQHQILHPHIEHVDFNLMYIRNTMSGIHSIMKSTNGNPFWNNNELLEMKLKHMRNEMKDALRIKYTKSK